MIRASFRDLVNRGPDDIERGRAGGYELLETSRFESHQLNVTAEIMDTTGRGASWREFAPTGWLELEFRGDGTLPIPFQAHELEVTSGGRRTLYERVHLVGFKRPVPANGQAFASWTATYRARRREEA